MAGIAGVLSVFYNTRITPGSINLAQTIDVLIVAVIGGLYRLEGAWVGALTYALIDNYSREWVPEVGNVLGPARFNTLIGVLFLIIVLASPGGLIGIWDQLKTKIKTPRRHGTGTDAGATDDRIAHTRGERECSDVHTSRWSLPVRPSRPAVQRSSNEGAPSSAGGDEPATAAARRSRSASCRTARARSARSSSRRPRARTSR